MADKLMYPIGSFKYGTRRLVAGDDPVLMNGRDQRLYLALKKVSETKPKSDAQAIRDDVAAMPVPTPITGKTNSPPRAAGLTAAPVKKAAKRKPRKKAAPKK